LRRRPPVELEGVKKTEQQQHDGRNRELRHLVQLRDTHVEQLTATKCRIKALLLYEGRDTTSLPSYDPC
jgi:hypothetical protein